MHEIRELTIQSKQGYTCTEDNKTLCSTCHPVIAASDATLSADSYTADTLYRGQDTFCIILNTSQMMCHALIQYDLDAPNAAPY